MSMFDDKLFEFLTQPNNWAVIREVYEKKDGMIYKLKAEFWREVSAGLRSKYDSDPATLEYKQDARIILRRKGWNDIVSIRYDGLFGKCWIGIHYDVSKIPQPVIQQAREKLKQIDNRLISEEWWLGFYYIHDFSQLTQLDKILPHVRESMVREYVEIFVNFDRQIAPVIDDVMKTL